MSEHKTITEKLLWLLETCRLSHHRNVPACDDAIEELRASSVEAIYAAAERGCGAPQDWVEWLGRALIMRNTIARPDFNPVDILDQDDIDEIAPLLNVGRELDYYPFETLIDGIERVYAEEVARG